MNIHSAYIRRYIVIFLEGLVPNVLHNKVLVLGAILPIIATFLLLYVVDMGAIPLVANSLPPDIIFIPTLVLAIASFCLTPVLSYYYFIASFLRNSWSSARRSSLLLFLAFELPCYLLFNGGYFFARKTISFGTDYVSMAYLMATGVPTLLCFILGSWIAKDETKKNIMQIRMANL